jgi:hypothetical protein
MRQQMVWHAVKSWQDALLNKYAYLDVQLSEEFNYPPSTYGMRRDYNVQYNFFYRILLRTVNSVHVIRATMFSLYSQDFSLTYHWNGSLWCTLRRFQNLFLSICTVWMWAVLPTFQRCILSPSSGSKYVGWLSIRIYIVRFENIKTENSSPHEFYGPRTCIYTHIPYALWSWRLMQYILPKRRLTSTRYKYPRAESSSTIVRWLMTRELGRFINRAATPMLVKWTWEKLQKIIARIAGVQAKIRTEYFRSTSVGRYR